MKNYIKVQDEKIVGAIGIDDTEEAPEGYTVVDDKYIELLISGRPLLYKDGKVIVDTATELKNEETSKLEDEITFLKSTLSVTDYVIIKIAEGVATKEDYAEVLKKRAVWRNRINELEEALKNG